MSSGSLVPIRGHSRARSYGFRCGGASRFRRPPPAEEMFWTLMVYRV
jgi:hypothetical protein